jgi:hypothetical protein
MIIEIETYAWREGARFTSDPVAVGKRLKKLAQQNGGRLTASDVVDDAKNSDSPYHDEFEWDNARAAVRYREEQARHLLRSLTVIRKDHGDKPIHAYVALTEDVSGSPLRAYVPIVRVLDEPDLLRQAIRDALRDLRSFERRYQAYDELAEIGKIAVKKAERLAAKLAKKEATV